MRNMIRHLSTSQFWFRLVQQKVFGLLNRNPTAQRNCSFYRQFPSPRITVMLCKVASGSKLQKCKCSATVMILKFFQVLSLEEKCEDRHAHSCCTGFPSQLCHLCLQVIGQAISAVPLVYGSRSGCLSGTSPATPLKGHPSSHPHIRSFIKQILIEHPLCTGHSFRSQRPKPLKNTRGLFSGIVPSNEWRQKINKLLC